MQKCSSLNWSLLFRATRDILTDAFKIQYLPWERKEFYVKKIQNVYNASSIQLLWG